METRDHVAHEAELPRGTLSELFLEATERFRDRPAQVRIRPDESLEPITYGEVLDHALTVAGALGARGLERGDKVAILSENRPEWATTDYGALLAGVWIVPVYSTLTPDQVRYLLTDSGARLAVVSDREQLDKILEIREACSALEGIATFEEVEEEDDDVVTWDEFQNEGWEARRKRGDEAIVEEGRRADPDDVATMLYTSGTTGDPKGVMLTHQNIFSNVMASREPIPVGPEDVTLSILPLSHIFQRMVDYLFFHGGCSIAYPRSRDTIPRDMSLVRPTVMVAVPRVYEKIYNRVVTQPGLKGKLVGWSREVGEAVLDHRLRGEGPGLSLRLRHAVADRLVFRKIRERVGGRIRYFVSGGGPLSPQINRFFHAVGLPILEGYGLTETSPVTNVNTPDDFRIGTVGKPVAGTEIRLAEDGEILVRGPQVMKGYYENPEATEEAIDEEGWFRTGDVGTIDADGFLTITDRKKDLIITSGGKNIAPQPIENRLKRNRFVEQAVMVGDGRKFASILVVPAFEALATWAASVGIETGSRSALLSDPRIHELLVEELSAELEDLARYERPKKIGLIQEELTVEGGALTPTEKVKRRVVEERYRELIETFYREENVEKTIFVAEPRPAQEEAA